jgi:hypothetical protein
LSRARTYLESTAGSASDIGLSACSIHADIVDITLASARAAGAAPMSRPWMRAALVVSEGGR